jgi:hypothetical protein
MRLNAQRKRCWLGVGVAAIAAFAAPGKSAVSGSGTITMFAASALCSKTEATVVVKQLHLGEADFIPNPVYAVICGAFMGPKSQNMVVSLASGGTSIPFEGWAVFRLAGGTWQLVMRRHDGAQVSAAGSDIRETVGVSRPGDPRCCPSGGTKSRIWHWNGSRFVADAWKQVTPADSSKSGAFKTPSANIVCEYFIQIGSRASESSVGCVIRSGLKPAPPRRPCQEGGYAGDRVYLGVTGRVRVPSCAGDPGPYVSVNTARVLGYGKTWSGGGFRCTSAESGLTCRNTSGHGFFLSRERWRPF